MQKRKTLVNALANSSKFGTKEQIEKMLQTLEIDNKIRPEKLTLEEFTQIAEAINKIA